MFVESIYTNIYTDIKEQNFAIVSNQFSFVKMDGFIFGTWKKSAMLCLVSILRPMWNIQQ